MSVESLELGLVDRIRKLGPPNYRAVVARTYTDAQKQAALGASFRIFNRTLPLAPPIDWRQDPFESRSWRYELHTLQILDVLFQLYRTEGSRPALEQARDIALDWIRCNRPGEAEISEFAWYDMAVGLRAPYLAYLLRAAVVEGVLSDEEIAALYDSLREHGEFLSDDANYARGHNHGLFQDEGLCLLADYLPMLGEAERWREIASRRVVETLRATVNWGEAIHLEHSPAYHFVIVNMIRRLRQQAGLGGAELEDLLTRMEETAGWLVLPDDTLPELGDTDPVPVPHWARQRARRAHGMRAFLDSGFATVRAGGSYLILTDGYHSHGHKHADELSFLLFENGQRIVGDTGRFGYYEREPERIYARSSHAHNALVVDGESFDWRSTRPYGSGLRAAGSGSGWFAVLGENPLLRAQGVIHRRLFLYSPAQALILVDEVTSDEEHVYTRLLHFGTDIRVADAGDLLHLRGDDFSGAVHDWTGGHAESRRLRRGEREPELRGWTFPHDREGREVTTAEFEQVARDGLFALAISLRTPAIRVISLAKADDDGFRLVIEDGAVNSALVIRTTGASLSVTEEKIR